MKQLICISHLRWDFVWQRPQQLLARLANHYPILFVEEPVHTAAVTTPRLEIRQETTPNVTVIRLLYPAASEQKQRWLGHGDPLSQPVYSHLLKEYLVSQQYTNPLLWLYTPMGHEFAGVIEPALFIYDVMDQLSAFKGAPTELPYYEEQMLRKADIVFTGGVSLYRAKKEYNPATYVFPSGVEIEHFERAANRANFVRPADLPEEGKPLLGYFGVIDERMDLELLAYLSTQRPDWNIALVGPLAKISPEDLPAASNIILPGMKTYRELPAYLAWFDVTLVPFALNEATRFLSPTKTLEYLAAHKSVVATPIADLAELYGTVVHVATNPPEFVQKVELALREDPVTKQTQRQKILNEARWDTIAAHMQRIIAKKLIDRL